MDKLNQKLPHYIIGTRGSLLALTQCLQVKKELESSGLATFSLKIIKTQGDENTQVPLWQLEGKDFFTKELDAALLKKEIDMVVHSYKDLGSERPIGIKLAAITKRDYAHDILFIKKSVLEDLQKKKVQKIIVGTSSPRRMTNLERNLKSFLPYGDELNISVETKSLRGNVNSRLEKCIGGEYDAVVLALPGIERLALGLDNQNNEAFEKFGNPVEILKGLIKELDFMVLPLSSFPAAASQGALGIECLEERDDAGHLISIIEKLNHDQTIKEVKEERKLFQSYGGGCHLAVGISVSSWKGGLRKSLAGIADDQLIKEVSLIREESLPKIEGRVFIGLPNTESFKNVTNDLVSKKAELETPLTFTNGQDILITSPSVLRIKKKELSQKENVNWWASGIKTMKEMASAGMWVHGCADSLGEAHLEKIRKSKLITLFLGKPDWTSLSHELAQTTLGSVKPVYKRETSEKIASGYIEEIESCSLYYWTSYPQYKTFQSLFSLNPSAVHASGLGKTFEQLKNEINNLVPISSMNELKDWLK
ncbi:MAG: hydroxymethylbilane synthase [Bacteriovoracaceae bacterium]|nr:hydroxymethylbilane synthase [Bacteriovoracaceae bacterium]